MGEEEAVVGRVGGVGAELPRLSEAEREGLRNLQRGVGEVCLFLAGHAAYGHLMLEELRRVVMMPVLLNQYRVVWNGAGRTVGFVSWARVSEEVHARLMGGVLKLRARDWRGGEVGVVMDVAAGTEEGVRRILRELKAEVFGGEALWVVEAGVGRLRRVGAA